MPLSCDCYGGCWGDHSKDWPSITDKDKSLRKLAIQVLPYGTYVIMDNRLRIETVALAQILIEKKYDETLKKSNETIK